MSIKRALISVSDKTGIVEFAKSLSELSIEIISTGGTYALLNENNIPVKKVSDITEFPEILNNRVKTLHPKIHGGILARRDDDHRQQLQEHGIPEIDLVVVNLYPFEQTVAKDGVTETEAIEQIDIGGPTMIRAAAKNQHYVSVIVDQSDYTAVADELKNDHTISLETRKSLALKAFQHTASYDVAIANYLAKEQSDDMPEKALFSFSKKQDLRYGENPHQQAAFYSEKDSDVISIANSNQLWGKELSYNNIMDLDASLNMALDFIDESRPFICIIKHSNPCGAALGDNVLDAYKKAVSCDPVSYFGGIVGCNKEIDKDAATEMAKSFLECIVAPGFSVEALDILKAKKNIRLIEYDSSKSHVNPGHNVRRVRGGLLVQDYDALAFEISESDHVTSESADKATLSTLSFAWKMIKHVKSNAIILAKNDQLIGVGAGQMSRVDSVKIAIQKANENNLDTQDSVMASDAFFPFRDGVDTAAGAHVKAVIQPGGSVKDQDVIDACNEHQMIMYFTGKRHFNH